MQHGPAEDQTYWADRSRALRCCGFLKRYECVCGQEYGKAVWPCHMRLCPGCAARRAAVLVERAETTLRALADAGQVYTLAMVTLTIPDRRYAGLVEGFDVLANGLKLLERRRSWRQGNVRGRLTAIEVKRGAGSGLWHPHAHVLVVLPGAWSEAAVQSWGAGVVMDWAGGVMPGSSALAQDCRVIGLARLREVVKYSVKTSTLTEDAGGNPRPVADVAADVVEVTEFLRKRRLVRTAGCLYGLEGGVEDESGLPEDQAGGAPACLCCGAPAGLRECPAVERRDRLPRHWCVPYPGVRGWYVAVLAADWCSGADPPWGMDWDRRLQLDARLREADSRLS